MKRLFRLLVVLVATSFVSRAAEERLNILFVFADDWGRYASAYAKVDGRPTLNDVVRTPNVDRVAREGALFRRAFVNAPSCTPCRSSLFSGRYFFNTGRGAILQGAVWDAAIPTFPLLLRDAGYHIGKSYKVWGPGSPGDAPFDGQKHAFEGAGRMPNNFSEETEKLVKDGMSVAAAREKILGQVRGNFDAFLAARTNKNPWLYFLGVTTTHRVWVKGSGKNHWGIEPESLKGKMPAFLPDVPEVREDVADYLGECQAVDACVGEVLKRLEESGELERTVVVVSGDHGMPGVPQGKCNLYDHGSAVTLAIRWPGVKGGRVIDDLVTLPDLAPTFMEIGGVKPPENLYGRSLVTLLKSGKSGQVEAERTGVVIGRERHVELANDGAPYPMRALRTADFLYVKNFEPDRWPMGSPRNLSEANTPSQQTLENDTRSCFADMDASPTKAWLVQNRATAQGKPFFDRAFAKRPAEELYDLTKDPDQTVNVASDPAYAAQKEKLAAELMARLKAADDPRLHKTVPFEQPPFTDLDVRGKKAVPKK